MVPPEEIEKPTTLPADFSEWDSGEASAAQPASFNGFQAAPKPRIEQAPARVAVPPPPPRPPVKVRTEQEQVFSSPRSKSVEAIASREEVEESRGKSGKGLVFGIAGGVLVLLAGVGALGYHKLQPKTIAPTKSVAAPQLTTTTMNAAQPSTGSTTATASAPVATTAAAAPSPSANSGQERPARSQSDMMNHQLNAPSRIPNDLRMLGGKEPPPSSGFGGSGMEGMSGGAGNVFGQNGTKVKVEASRRMSISAGVAGGLLIQKTAPVYPQLAKEARISGTVVIQATISKYGTIQNPRVVSGSTMLRQAALDAVKSWRYKPYVLDGEPVEVETTVSVSFNLGG